MKVLENQKKNEKTTTIKKKTLPFVILNPSPVASNGVKEEIMGKERQIRGAENTINWRNLPLVSRC